MLEISVQSGNWYQENDPEGSFRFIRECGFEAIDYNIDQFLEPQDIREGKPSAFFDRALEDLLAYYKPMKEAADRYQVAVSQMHAPFPLYVEGNDAYNAYLITVVEKVCAICQYLECSELIVHPFNHPVKAVEKEINLQMYRKMIPAAKKYGVTLCLENLYRRREGHTVEGACANAAEACWYIDTLNEEAGEEVFGFCFDVGHANIMGTNIREYLKTLDKRLVALHIHDTVNNADSHMIPYTQTHFHDKKRVNWTDWEGVIEGLRDIQYKGQLSFETFQGIDNLPEEVREEGLKLVSAIGRYFKKRIEL